MPAGVRKKPPDGRHGLGGPCGGQPAARRIANPCPARSTGRVQLELIFPPPRPRLPGVDHLRIGDRHVPLRYVRNGRARRYILRVESDSTARITVPRGGSVAAARAFAARHVFWIARQLQRRADAPILPQDWRLDTEILFRGDPARLVGGTAGTPGTIHFGGQVVPVADTTGNLRPAIERHLWQLAAGELPPRVFDLATAHHLAVRRVTVRNQRSRWGSCSRRGTISLNWRLIQAPPFVRDYIMLHELTHLREMNHSLRFWRAVAAVCPDYQRAEHWLKQHGQLLR